MSDMAPLISRLKPACWVIKRPGNTCDTCVFAGPTIDGFCMVSSSGSFGCLAFVHMFVSGIYETAVVRKTTAWITCRATSVSAQLRWTIDFMFTLPHGVGRLGVRGSRGIVVTVSSAISSLYALLIQAVYVNSS
jgi:hypothetical protein